MLPGVKTTTLRKRTLSERGSEPLNHRMSRTGSWEKSESTPSSALHLETRSDCDSGMTPACIAALYQIPRLDSLDYAPHRDSALGVFEEGGMSMVLVP